MTSKEAVLAFLERNKGTYVSGETIARQLQITRAAIWRAIRDLRGEGHVIEASTRVGYRLNAESDILSSQGILSALEPLGLASLPVHYHPSIGSTNREAKRLALEGAPHGTVVVAGMQSEGRGRNGRSFYSPNDSGLYLSMLLRPEVETAVALRVTCAAAVAVCKGIEETCALHPRIKWVNDVYVDGLKVCGILTEGGSGFESGRIESIVVGIGVNHTVPDGGFPAELQQIAGALFATAVPPQATRAKLAASIIAHLYRLADDLASDAFMEEYRRRSMVIGKPVTVMQGIDRYEAQVESITDDGALAVRLSDGSGRLLQSGEISLRPPAGGAW